MISTYNTTVVSCINKQGGTLSPNLCVDIWEILHWCLEYDIVIRAGHIPGKFNILAAVFRDWTDLYKQKGFGSIGGGFHFPNAQLSQCGFVDLFATRFNHKLPLYMSSVLDNHALAIDALSLTWNFLHVYAFPPTILIPSKIRQSRCRIVLIAPLWP